MLDQLEDRDLCEVDLLRPGKVEKQVERTFPPVEGQIQLIRLADRPFLEILVNDATIPISCVSAKSGPHSVGDN